jgi:hypothetical protein
VKRSASLKRTGRVKAKRSTPRRSNREHDQEYMAKVRELPCIVGEMLPHSFVHEREMHAHHMGARGLGQKCSDYETVPMCALCHANWHNCADEFAGWSKEKRREFAQATIEATQGKLGRLK